MEGEGGGAVAAEAPVSGAPVAGKEVGAVDVETAPKKRTIDDDLDDIFKKHSGYEYAKGKKLDTAANLKRMLGRVGGVESAANKALQTEKESEALKGSLSRISQLPPSERLGALEKSGIDPKLIREAVEESILAEHAKEQERQGMTERERQFAKQLEEREQELGKYRQEQEAAKLEQEHEAFVARVNEVGRRLEDVTVKALQRAKITPESSPHFIQAIADRLDRNERLGLGLDEGELADVVLKEQEDMATGFLKTKAPADLADMLDASGLSRPLMEEFARRIRAKVTGGIPAPVASRPVIPSKQNGQSDVDKMAFWRTNRGG